MNNYLIKILLLSFFVSTSATAEDPKSAKSLPEVGDLVGRMDFAVPQSPAFTILGVVPDGVINPTSHRSLALSLLEGVDADGNVQSGIAVDTKPYMLANGAKLTLEDYRDKNNMVKRQLARMQLSFATSSGKKNESQADRYALALRWTPWDTGDPRLDDSLETCRQEEIVLPDGGELADEGKPDPALEAALTKKDKECRTASKQRNWNASSWDIGVAGFRVDSDDSKTESGFALWSSLALRINTSGQFIAHIRASNNELAQSENAADPLVFSDNDTLSIGGRLRYGNERGALMVEALHTEIDSGSTNTDEQQYLIGAEYRLMEGFWIQLGFGEKSGDNTDESNDVYYSGQIRWAFSENRLLK